MMPRLILTVTLSAALAPLPCQAPAGYYLGESAFLPDSVREVLASGRFHITIERVTADSFEAKLLMSAERLFPDSATIGHAASRGTLPAVVSGFKAAATAAGNGWWWSSFDDLWTPYAITGDAVQYYRQWVYDRASSGKNHGEFVYRARVARIPPSRSDRASFVVRMEISLEYFCGILCGAGFRVERRVFFDAAGVPLRIEGDAKPMVVVS